MPLPSERTPHLGADELQFFDDMEEVMDDSLIAFILEQIQGMNISRKRARTESSESSDGDEDDP